MSSDRNDVPLPRHVRLLHECACKLYTLLGHAREWHDGDAQTAAIPLDRKFHVETREPTTTLLPENCNDFSIAIHFARDDVSAESILLEVWRLVISPRTNSAMAGDRVAQLHKQCVLALRLVAAYAHTLPAHHLYKACARARGRNGRLCMSIFATPHNATDAWPLQPIDTRRIVSVGAGAADEPFMQVHVTYTSSSVLATLAAPPDVSIVSVYEQPLLRGDDVEQFLRYCRTPPPLDLLRPPR